MSDVDGLYNDPDIMGLEHFELLAQFYFTMYAKHSRERPRKD